MDCVGLTKGLRQLCVKSLNRDRATKMHKTRIANHIALVISILMMKLIFGILGQIVPLFPKPTIPSIRPLPSSQLTAICDPLRPSQLNEQGPDSRNMASGYGLHGGAYA